MKKGIFIGLLIILFSSFLFTGCFFRPPGSSSTYTPVLPASGVLDLYSIDPLTLDPAISSEMTSHDYVSQIFSGLLQLGADLQPTPDIAESLPEISSDGLNYTFRLRKNVKFHDGKLVTANDFKYSWERAADPATGSQTAATYLGDIVGVKNMLAGKSDQVGGIKVVDDYTLQITIDSPKSYFLSKLTYPTSFVVDRENVARGVNWWQGPNGTGPFKFNQWTLNQSLTLDRNDHYYGEVPKIKQVKYQFYSGLPMDLYEKGQIEVTNVSTIYIDKVSDRFGPFYQDLTVSPEFSFSYLGFNCNKPPFDDANIRSAFSLAIDKDKIISLIYRDMVQKAAGVLPVGLPGYNSNLAGLSYDVNQAKELVRTSKYGDVSNLPPITLTTSGYGGSISSTLEAIVYQWKQNLGVDVQVRQLEPERFYYNIRNEITEIFDIGGWIADYAHPQDFIDILFNSSAENNYGGYSNAQVDSLIEQANQETDQAKSFALYQQAEQIIVDEAACLPLAFGKNYVLVKPYVKGYAVNPLGINALEKIYLESQ